MLPAMGQVGGMGVIVRFQHRAGWLLGDEQLPEDSERYPKGSLKNWPEWVTEGKPSPTGRYTFSSYRLWTKDAPLQDSGLLGPVRIVPMRRVELR